MNIEEYVKTEKSNYYIPFIFPNRNIIEGLMKYDSFLDKIFQSNPFIILIGKDLKELLTTDFYTDEILLLQFENNHKKKAEIKKELKFYREQYYIENEKEFEKLKSWSGNYKSLLNINPYLFFSIYNNIYVEVILKSSQRYSLKNLFNKISYAHFNFNDYGSGEGDLYFDQQYILCIPNIYYCSLPEKTILTSQNLNFGKYEFKTLTELYHQDNSYIDWLINTTSYCILDFQKLYHFDELERNHYLSEESLILNFAKSLHYALMLKQNDIIEQGLNDNMYEF